MILMVDKQAKFLSERLGWGNEAQKANTIKEIELASHVSLMSYLKQTFHQRNREFVSSKKVAKQFLFHLTNNISLFSPCGRNTKHDHIVK